MNSECWQVQHTHNIIISFTVIERLNCTQSNAKHNPLEVLLGFSDTLGPILLTDVHINGDRAQVRTDTVQSFGNLMMRC